MGKNKWFKFYPSDFLAGIHNLEQMEVTAYIVAICEMYDKEGRCPRNDSVMARRCNMRKARFTKALDGLIAKGKVEFYAGVLTNKRVLEEIEYRTKAALERAQQRHNSLPLPRPSRAPAVPLALHLQPENQNENNENAEIVGANLELRNKNTSLSSFDVAALPPASRRALEDYEKRKRQRSTKSH